MNKQLLRKIEKHILQEPKRFVMTTINVHGTPGEETGLGGKFAKCGTAACICGWACGLSGIPWDRASLSEGERVLEISTAEANLLFAPDYWPEKFKAGLEDDGKAKTAKVAVARIEHFIKTNGQE